VAQSRVSTSRQIAAQSVGRQVNARIHRQAPVGQWFSPLVKTAADQTLKRSITTQLIAIQPPPLLTMNGVMGVLRTSLIPHELRSG